MEILIKIPDEDYKFIQDLQILRLGSRAGYKTIQQTVINAIKNGTPLPNGHGRLIDADKLDTRERGNNSQRTMWYQIDCIVKHAPTIVEADKENKKTDNLPSCNNCVHNGEWSSTGNCIKCSCFDRYERSGNK